VRSGIACLVGRPNAGKSTLLNAIAGRKVTISSRVPQTTRMRVRAVLDRPGAQLVMVDTPGFNKPRNLLGARLNMIAQTEAEGADLTVLVIDATAPLGSGDRFVAAAVEGVSLCAVTKLDVASRGQVLSQLQAAGQWVKAEEYFPVSGRTGEGVETLVEAMIKRLPEGPRLYPEGTLSDISDEDWVAELVREQLLGQTRDEVPHSIACRTTDWEWPRIRVEILVERESQKPIVIGRRGSRLAAVGSAVRAQLPAGAYLELAVKVERNWQSREAALRRLGF
jgi:GTP-binding protein Era